MRLPRQTKQQRRQLAEISAADISHIVAFIDGMKARGATLDKKIEVHVDAPIVRQLFTAGTPGNRFTWHRPTLQYAVKGRFLKPPTIKAAADAVSNEARFKIMDAALRLEQGKSTVKEWIVEHDRWVKVLHGAESALARGGFAQMDARAWEAASERVAGQYGYSRAFAEDVAAGKFGVPGSKEFQGKAVLNRAGMYANAGRCTYENTRMENGRDQLGHTHARRILAAVSHCPDCAEEAARGFVPIDEAIPIGDCECHQNCHCVLITGRGDEE